MIADDRRPYCDLRSAIRDHMETSLKQRRRQRQRKRHLKIYLYFICATSRLFQLAQLLQK